VYGNVLISTQSWHVANINAAFLWWEELGRW